MLIISGISYCSLMYIFSCKLIVGIIYLVVDIVTLLMIISHPILITSSYYFVTMLPTKQDKFQLFMVNSQGVNTQLFMQSGFLIYNQLTCSAKFCDKLLFETDIFYHFRGLILLNLKCLQFNLNKKTRTQGHISASLIFPYILIFCNLWIFLAPFTLHIFFSLQRLHCHF